MYRMHVLYCLLFYMQTFLCCNLRMNVVFVGTWSMLSSVLFLAISSSENGSANLREWEVYTR